MKNRMTNFGFSTLLISFTMICILIFSVLALITSNSDYRLSRKVADKNTAYYEAEGKAYEIISKLDRDLYDAYQSSSSEAEYFSAAAEAMKTVDGAADGNNFYISLPLSDNQTLDITLEIKYPKSDKDSFYRICQWKNTTDTSVEDGKILELLD